MTPEEILVAEAIKSLRSTLNESQQQFSDRLGVVVRTVARYELEKPPEGEMLLKLAEIAREAQRRDLALIFQRVHSQSMLNRMRLYKEENSFGNSAMKAFLWILNQPGGQVEKRVAKFLMREIGRLVKARGYSLTESERRALSPFCDEIR